MLPFQSMFWSFYVLPNTERDWQRFPLIGTFGYIGDLGCFHTTRSSQL